MKRGFSPRHGLQRVLLLIGVLSLPIEAWGQNFPEIKPAPQQVAWQDLEVGVLIHFGTNTFLDREWGDGTADPRIFNPSDVTPEQWMKAAKSAGARYAILVAKHHDGFCLWPSAQTTYSIKGSPWKNGSGDLVRETSEAAGKYGLRFGVYLSPWDRHEPRYSDPAAYDKYYLAQLDELATNYGDLVEFWLDGAGSAGRTYDFARIIQELRTYQPNTLVFADVGLFQNADLRWVGNEKGVVEYENWNVIDRAGDLRWRPVESDTPLRNEHWFWHPNDEPSLKSVPELVDIYHKTVGRGAQLLLGIAPDREGHLPAPDAKRLEEFGEAIQQLYGTNLIAADRGHSTARAATDNDPDTFWSAPAGSHHAMLEVSFAHAITFDRALTMEWLNDGQHVQKYAIEVYHHNGWRKIAEGQAIGHKKIDIFPAVTSERIRLNLLSTSSEAHIREFQLFNGLKGNHP